MYICEYIFEKEKNKVAAAIKEERKKKYCSELRSVWFKNLIKDRKD